jgi:hypothetical protein
MHVEHAGRFASLHKINFTDPSLSNARTISAEYGQSEVNPVLSVLPAFGGDT